MLKSVTGVKSMQPLVLKCALKVGVEHLYCLVVAMACLLVLPPVASVLMVSD